MDYKKHITIVKDWPKEGIEFKDITPLMADGEAYKNAINEIVEYARDKKADLVVGPEAKDLSLDVLSLMSLKLALYQ